MADDDTATMVRKAYEKRKYTNVEVVDIRMFSNGDSLIALEAIDNNKKQVAEICMVSKGAVRIFDGDVDLINNIERPSRIWDWVISGHGVSALAFVVTLSALIGFGLAGKDKEPAFDVLKQICLLAAGFFLGNQVKSRS